MATKGIKVLYSVLILMCVYMGFVIIRGEYNNPNRTLVRDAVEYFTGKTEQSKGYASAGTEDSLEDNIDLDDYNGKNIYLNQYNTEKSKIVPVTFDYIYVNTNSIKKLNFSNKNFMGINKHLDTLGKPFEFVNRITDDPSKYYEYNNYVLVDESSKKLQPYKVVTKIAKSNTNYAYITGELSISGIMYNSTLYLPNNLYTKYVG